MLLTYASHFINPLGRESTMTRTDPHTVAIGEVHYDYSHQCWVRRVPCTNPALTLWSVERCGHQPSTGPIADERPGCYSCHFAGRTLDGSEVRLG